MKVVSDRQQFDTMSHYALQEGFTIRPEGKRIGFVRNGVLVHSFVSQDVAYHFCLRHLS